MRGSIHPTSHGASTTRDLGCRVANGLLMASGVLERSEAVSSGLPGRWLPLNAAGCRRTTLSAGRGRFVQVPPPTRLGRWTTLDAARGRCLPLQSAGCHEAFRGVGRVTAFHPPFRRRPISPETVGFLGPGCRLHMLLQMATRPEVSNPLKIRGSGDRLLVLRRRCGARRRVVSRGCGRACAGRVERSWGEPWSSPGCQGSMTPCR